MSADVAFASIPGLCRVMRDWNSLGNLVEAIASTGTSTEDRRWSQREVFERATRVFCLKNKHLILQLPDNETAWLAILPIRCERTVSWSSKVRGRANWGKTALKGWPPSEVYVRRKHRSQSSPALNVLSWVAATLMGQEFNSAGYWSDSAVAGESVIDSRIRAMGWFVSSEPPIRPDAGDIRSTAGLGGAWAPLAAIAMNLADFADGGFAKSAKELIAPAIADRFFQLECLGRVVSYVEDSLGEAAVSLTPIGGTRSTGPTYIVQDVEIWWEASGIWAELGIDSARRVIGADRLCQPDGSPFVARSDRPDLLIRGKDFVIVLECKYPDNGNPGYVLDGLPQAFFYAEQLREVITLVSAVVVGPTNVVTPDYAARAVGELECAIINPDFIPDLLASRGI